MPELRIDYLPPSPNQTRGMKWYVLKRHNEIAAKAVWKAWGDHPQKESLISDGRKAIVDVEICAQGLSDDEDNRVARLKGVIDALVRMGILWDDHEDFMQLNMPTRKRIHGRGYLVVSIQYVGD